MLRVVNLFVYERFSESLLVRHGRAEEDTRSCQSDSAVSASSQRPLQAGGWTPPPESGSKKNGGAERRNEWCLQRRRKKRSWWEEKREDRMRGWGQWRGETGRGKEKGRARRGTPAGQWSGCDSAGRGHWEGGTM